MRINNHGSYLALNNITSHPFWVRVQRNCCSGWAVAEPSFPGLIIHSWHIVCWLTLKSKLHWFYCWIPKLFLNRNACSAAPLFVFILSSFSQQCTSWRPWRPAPFTEALFLPLNIPFYCTISALFCSFKCHHESPRLTLFQSLTLTCAYARAGTQQWWCPSCTTPPIAPGREFLWWLPLCGSWPSLSPVLCCLVSTLQVRSTTFCLHLPV